AMEPDVRQGERKQTFKSSRFLVLTADANVTVSLPKIAPVRISKTAEMWAIECSFMNMSHRYK
ncbi:hypothetical protein R0J89_19085, partial [Psychrobacter sp. SIMBA_152]